MAGQPRCGARPRLARRDCRRAERVQLGPYLGRDDRQIAGVDADAAQFGAGDLDGERAARHRLRAVRARARVRRRAAADAGVVAGDVELAEAALCLGQRIGRQQAIAGVGAELTAQQGDESPNLVSSLVVLDAPKHPKLRRLTQEWFMPKNLKLIEADIRDLAKRTVDRLIAAGPEAVPNRLILANRAAVAVGLTLGLLLGVSSLLRT